MTPPALPRGMKHMLWKASGAGIGVNLSLPARTWCILLAAYYAYCDIETMDLISFEGVKHTSPIEKIFLYVFNEAGWCLEAIGCLFVT